MRKAKIKNIDSIKESSSKNLDVSVEMHVKRFIGFDEFTNAVNNIVNACFNQETGEVNYEAVDFVERAEIIERYTDYQLPDDVRDAFTTLYETNIYENARKNIDEGQIVRLLASAEAKLEAKERKANAAAESAALALISRFDSVSEQMENIFGDVTPEQISGIFNAMIDGKLDEEKIVNAVMARTVKEDEE